MSRADPEAAARSDCERERRTHPRQRAVLRTGGTRRCMDAGRRARSPPCAAPRPNRGLRVCHGGGRATSPRTARTTIFGMAAFCGAPDWPGALFCASYSWLGNLLEASRCRKPSMRTRTRVEDVEIRRQTVGSSLSRGLRAGVAAWKHRYDRLAHSCEGMCTMAALHRPSMQIS